MGKYIKRFDSISTATSAEDLVSPHLSAIDENELLLMLNCGEDVPVEIYRDVQGKIDIRQKILQFMLNTSKLDEGKLG